MDGVNVNVNELLQDACLEVGRKAIEDMLIELRDERIGLLGRNNGLVIKERDGEVSSIIRMGPEMALRVGIQAMVQQLQLTKQGRS